MTLTCSAFYGKIVDAEGNTDGFASGVKLPIRVCYSVTLSKLPDGTGGEFCFTGQDGLASVGSTTPALTHSARSALQAMTNVPHDDSPRQLSLFDPIQIPLYNGQITLIDPIDVDLAALRWTPQAATGGGYYAVRMQNPGSIKIYLHRLILSRLLDRSLLRVERTDHINGDKLDNRRSNLRVATPAQSNRNIGKPITNTSGYKGVVWDKEHHRWHAQIGVNNRTIFLGRFDTPEEAYKAYCEAAKKYHGEFARFE